MLLVKQQPVVTHRYTILQETEKTWQIFNRPICKHVMFLGKYVKKQLFCGHKISTEGKFETLLSNNAGI